MSKGESRFVYPQMYCQQDNINLLVKTSIEYIAHSLLITTIY